MLDHARTQPLQEVCGLLGGSDGLINNFYPVDNVSDERRCAFLMDPAGQICVLRIMRERGETMFGIFHSHPDTPARPSARDLQEARYADVYYFIASLQHCAPVLKAWYFDGRQFDEVSIAMDLDDHRSQHPRMLHTRKP